MKLVEWNEALLRDLEARARPERRLYLYVGRETLADVSGLDEHEALDDFCGAFRAARGSRPFLLGATAADRWAARGYEGDPPFVADLAMTVLAVTEEPVGALHGVYRRQNSLLGRAAEAEAPPGYGEDVPSMWRVWNRWLEGPGRHLGQPSARTHDVWTLQGWARSQGLVRHRDRLAIEQFVEERGPGVGRLDVRDLVVWLRYRGAVSADLLARVDGDQAALEVVQDVLDDEAARWLRDGLRERGQRTIRGLLLYDDWARVEWSPRAPSSRSCLLTSGRERWRPGACTRALANVYTALTREDVAPGQVVSQTRHRDRTPGRSTSGRGFLHVKAPSWVREVRRRREDDLSGARERLAELLIAPHAGIRDLACAARTYARAMAFHHEVSTEIRFVTDGRVYEPVGRRAGDFIIVYGQLLSGPAWRPFAEHEFHATCLRPDGDELIAEARLDHPSDPDLVHETEFMVFLFALGRDDVPPGTVITSFGRVVER